MARKSQRDTEKVTIRLFRGDADKLSALFPTAGYNKVIRHLISNFIKGIEEKTNKQFQPSQNLTQVDISSIMEENPHDNAE